LTTGTKTEQYSGHLEMAAAMHADPNSLPTSEPDQLETATDQAIAACGGNARDAVKALIVANEYLESEVCELMQAVSHAYARGRFKTYTG
jgi:stage V sporulation protein SpoVS